MTDDVQLQFEGHQIKLHYHPDAENKVVTLVLGIQDELQAVAKFYDRPPLFEVPTGYPYDQNPLVLVVSKQFVLDDVVEFLSQRLKAVGLFPKVGLNYYFGDGRF